MAKIGFKRNVKFAVAEIARIMSFRERSDYGLNHVSSLIAFLKCMHAHQIRLFLLLDYSQLSDYCVHVKLREKQQI